MKEDDAAAAAQATTSTVHREQEALIAAMAAARKTLNEVQAHEHTTILVWEKEKTIVPHLEQQLTAAPGIVIPQYDDDDRSIDASSNPDATLITHLHARAVGLQNIQSVVTIVLKYSSSDYKRWSDLMLLMFHCYALDDHVLSNVTDPSVYWARLDNIMVT
jgi:hypothetical protein